MHVDLANRSDLEALQQLLLSQFDEHEIEVPYEALKTAIARILEDDHQGFFVVAQGGEALGVAAVSFAWTLEHGGLLAWLDELHVVEAHRNRGLGRELLRHALVETERRDCAVIDLEVAKDHQRAERLYEREGFRSLDRSRWVRSLGTRHEEGIAKPLQRFA